MGRALFELGNTSSFNMHTAPITTTRGICSNVEDDPVKERLDCFFTPLAESYKKICQQQDRQFFGLRDFYRLEQCNSNVA